MLWSPRGSRRWCQRRYRRWFRRRLQLRGPWSPSIRWQLLRRLVVFVLNFRHSPRPRGLPQAREWRWSWGTPLYASGDISMNEAVSTAHQALSQAHHVLHCEGEDLIDERRHLQLWASMLKQTTMFERVVVRARQHGFDL
jgi:hypothetical protein